MANSDLAALAEQHRFVADEDDVAEMQQTWEGRMALKYSEMLYKEYAVIDLSREWDDLLRATDASLTGYGAVHARVGARPGWEV